MGKIENLIQAALDQMDHPFFIKDENRLYRYVNSKAADLAGLTPDDFIGKKDEEIFGEAVGNRYREKDLAVLQGKIVYPIDVFTDANGNTQTYFIVRQLFYHENKKTAGILGLRVNVTNYLSNASERND